MNQKKALQEIRIQEDGEADASNAVAAKKRKIETDASNAVAVKKRKIDEDDE